LGSPLHRPHRNPRPRRAIRARRPPASPARRPHHHPPRLAVRETGPLDLLRLRPLPPAPRSRPRSLSPLHQPDHTAHPLAKRPQTRLKPLKTGLKRHEYCLKSMKTASRRRPFSCQIHSLVAGVMHRMMNRRSRLLRRNNKPVAHRNHQG
jgi:hypothetical protein